MAHTNMQDSRVTFSGGVKGLAFGALAGGILAALLSTLFAALQFGEGGPGVHFISGAAFGGLVGLFIGMLGARRKLGPNR